MANYTGYVYDTEQLAIWHSPENSYPLTNGYGLSYGRFYGQYLFLPEDQWGTRPFWFHVGYGNNYGRFYQRSLLPFFTPEYSVGGYGRNYGSFYGFWTIQPANLSVIDDTDVVGAGAHTDNLPVGYSSVNYTGYRAPTLTDFFYNRLLKAKK